MDLDTFLDKTYGFDEATWADGRRWLTRHLREVARAQQSTFYGDVCDAMRKAGHISLEPHGTPFAGMLGQINVLEHDAGRPLISAVVLSNDTMAPGVGFWNIAKDIGIPVGETDRDREAFWVDAFRKCQSFWRTRNPQS